jgi:hypothetical protein
MLWRPPSDAEALAAARASVAATAFAGELGYFVGVRPAPERAAIVLLAGVNAVAGILEQACIGWVALAPRSFKTIGVDSGLYLSVYLVLHLALNLAVVAGAGALLLGRRSVGRRALLCGGIGFILFQLYGYIHFLAAPPPGYPRYAGAERVVNTVASVARIGTSLIVYALVVAAVARRQPRDGTQSGD